MKNFPKINRATEAMETRKILFILSAIVLALHAVWDIGFADNNSHQKATFFPLPLVYSKYLLYLCTRKSRMTRR